MMNFDFKFVLPFLLLLPIGNLLAQDTIPISDGGTVESTNCDNGLILTDSNADDGNYEPGEIFQITACINTLVGDSVQVSILPPLNQSDTVNVWDVDENSTLMIYAGTDTDGELLGTFNSVTDPSGVYLTTTVPCVTFVWESGESSSGEGFIANIECLQDLQPFNVSVLIDPPFGLSTDTFPDIGPNENVITFCFGDTLNFTANPTFPLSNATGDGYEQLVEETTFTWDMGNGDVFEGVGLTELTYGYPEPGGYFATLTVTDIMGQVETYDAYLLQAPRPRFSNIVFGDTLCLGDTTVITGGILFPDTVGVSPSTSAVQPNYDFTDSRFLPDGNGEEYQTTIEIEGYLDDPVISEIGDFVNVCLNMEHTYLGDLEAWLTCPSGQSALLFDGFAGEGGYPGTGFSGFGTFLGDANDDGTTLEGIGFDYCFADDAALGTMEDEFNAGNTVEVNSFPPGGDAMVEGTYLPAENFETAFDGCPLNGDWTLTIRDNIGADNGYIFNWSMEFGPNFELDTIYYTPDIIEAYWLENDDIVTNTDTSVTVLPSQEGNNAFTFVVEDSFGCLHDTTFLVYVRPLPELNDRTACDRTDELFPSNAPQGGEFELLSAPDEASDLIFTDFGPFGQADVVLNEEGLYGDYIVEFTEQICGIDSMVPAYRDTALIDFRPYPMIEPFFEDSTLCGGASILLDAGPQFENSENFIIDWTRDGNAFNQEDLSVSVDESGLYVLTMFEPACPDSVVSDTTLIEAIDISFEGDTICGLTITQGAILVEVNPESIGADWSSSEEGVNFQNTNNVSTQLVVDDYGDYPITYTDARCPNDAETRNFKFVQQPDITLLPQNPVICFEEDSLTLTAVVTGSTSGVYFWDVDTLPDALNVPDFTFGQEATVVFPPMELRPLNNYYVVAETRDEFGVCPNPGRDTLIFEPLACNYAIPNVITPNGDGRNDLFDIEDIENFASVSIKIFNRWGNMVFDNGDYGRYEIINGGWDPEDLPGGVYFYEIEIPSIDRVESGNFSILTESGSEQ